jgi:hypothetical protein
VARLLQLWLWWVRLAVPSGGDYGQPVLVEPILRLHGLLLLLTRRSELGFVEPLSRVALHCYRLRTEKVSRHFVDLDGRKQALPSVRTTSARCRRQHGARCDPTG